ncbi:MAG: ABC transporter permease [Eubacteriales bacterium]|nr:ABC transporter permease [Eubacteriales bacterium]MDY3332701.1 ABC transporter permease [Gallibacter sp.]
MKQFFTIFKFELNNLIRNKVFIVMTILFIILVAGLLSFPRFSGLFAGDSSDDSQSTILIKLENKEYKQQYEAAFKGAFKDNKVEFTEASVDDIKDKVTSGDVESAFIIKNETSYDYLINNASLYDFKTEVVNGIMSDVYKASAMVENGVSPDKATSIITTKIDCQTQVLGKDQRQTFFYTYIMIFALYMVILLYGQIVSTSVAAEKSSRAMEVLITSAKPINMMFGKVLASCLAGFVQLAAIFGAGIVFYQINKGYWVDNLIVESIFSIPMQLFIYLLVFFVLGYLLYAFLFAAMGSAVSKVEELNTVNMPIIFLFVIAFIIVISSISSGDVDSVLLIVCSYIPFTSSMAMFSRIAMGSVAFYEILISIAILIATVGAIGVLSARIYRVGVLLYGAKPKFKDIIKSVFIKQ